MRTDRAVLSLLVFSVSGALTAFLVRMAHGLVLGRWDGRASLLGFWFPWFAVATILFVSFVLLRRRPLERWIPFASVFVMGLVASGTLPMAVGAAPLQGIPFLSQAWMKAASGPLLSGVATVALFFFSTRLRGATLATAMLFLHAILVIGTAAWTSPVSAGRILQSVDANGYLHAARMVPSVDFLLRYYHDLRQLPQWPPHAAFNLPGKTMLFMVFTHIGLSPDAMVWALLALVASGAVAVYLYATRWGGMSAGWLGGLLWPYVSSLLLTFPIVNPVIAAVTCWVMLLVRHAFLTGHVASVVASGSAVSLLALTDPVALGAMGFPLAESLIHPRGRRAAWLGVAEVGCVFMGCLGLLHWGWGFSYVAAARHSASLNEAFNPGLPWPVWIYRLMDPVIFIVGVGVPLIGIFLSDQTHRWVLATTGALIVTLTVLGFGGEVERIWLFLTPFIAAAAGIVLENTQALAGRMRSALPILWQIVYSAGMHGSVLFAVPEGAVSLSQRSRRPAVVVAEIAKGRITGGQIAEAEKLLAYAQQLDPHESYVLTVHGDLLWQQKKYTEMTAVQRSMVKLKPDAAEEWYKLGVACALSGDSPAAKDAFAETLKRNPTHAAARRNYDILARRLGQRH